MVGLRGFVDREQERRRAIQLVHAVAGAREIMVRPLVEHREPSALRRDLSKLGGCVLAIILNLVQRQKERGEGSAHPPQRLTGIVVRRRAGGVRSISSTHIKPPLTLYAPTWLCPGNTGEMVGTLPGNIRVGARRER